MLRSFVSFLFVLSATAINGQNMEWAWIKGDKLVPVYGTLGIPSSANNPGARVGHSTWTDANGSLWMFGGGGYMSNDVSNDLWKYNPTTNEWTWVKGSNRTNAVGVYGSKGVYHSNNTPGARRDAVSWIDASGNLWLLGGEGYDNRSSYGLLNDLWSFSPSTNEWKWVQGDFFVGGAANYGTIGTSAASNKPGARSDAVSWKDNIGNLWLFGGKGYASQSNPTLNDLWKYNISANEWTWVSGDNIANQYGVYGTIGAASSANKPGARSNGLSWTDDTGDLWLFGGKGFADSDSGRLSDLWKYNVATNIWTWMNGDNNVDANSVYGTLGIEAEGNKPGARESSVSWKDANGNLWMLGGWGKASENNTGSLNDLWKYNTALNQWTWMKGDSTIERYGVYGTLGVASASNKPGARYAAASWTDPDGNFWLASGVGNASDNKGDINDLWKYNTATSQWTWIKGDKSTGYGVYGTKGIASALNKPGARQSGVSWADGSGNLWLFGGLGKANSPPGLFTNSYLNDLWKYEISSNEWVWVKGDSVYNEFGQYGMIGSADVNNKPGARYHCTNWTDASGNLWLFGGYGEAPGREGAYFNDLWKYNPSNNQWTWIKGDNTPDVFGIYGTMGQSSPANKPGSRTGATGWRDTNGNLWLFGGSGFGDGSSGTGAGSLNDLWKFDLSNNQWTWVKGDKTPDNAGVYGTLGTASGTNKPGGRSGAMGWTDATGSLWLFGGSYLNDLWKYNPTTNEWTWMKGGRNPDLPGTYGTLGKEAADNQPGARIDANTWADANGDLWLFGGRGYTNAGIGYLNDLWKFTLLTNDWTWMMGDSTLDPVGNYGTLGTASASNMPSGRQRGASWFDAAGNVWLFGGTNTSNLNDLWRLSAAGTLPITLLSFTGLQQGERCNLNWLVENEAIIKHYEVERSLDAENFTKIAELKAINSRRYMYSDIVTDLTEKNLHYRLKLVEKDGSFNYSSIIKIRFNKEPIIKLYPNPATTHFQLHYSKNIIGKINLEILDVSGKLVGRKVFASSNIITVSTSKLLPGEYLVKVIADNEQSVLKLQVVK